VNDEIPILIVDDEPEVRALMHDYFAGLGHQVAEAGNGLEGLFLMKKHRPKVILLDLMMPRIGGLDAIRHIQQFDPAIRIVVMSGHVDDILEAELQRRNIAVLRKPLNLDALAAMA